MAKEIYSRKGLMTYPLQPQHLNPLVLWSFGPCWWHYLGKFRRYGLMVEVCPRDKFQGFKSHAPFIPSCSFCGLRCELSGLALCLPPAAILLDTNPLESSAQIKASFINCHSHDVLSCNRKVTNIAPFLVTVLLL